VAAESSIMHSATCRTDQPCAQCCGQYMVACCVPACMPSGHPACCLGAAKILLCNLQAPFLSFGIVFGEHYRHPARWHQRARQDTACHLLDVGAWSRAVQSGWESPARLIASCWRAACHQACITSGVTLPALRHAGAPEIPCWYLQEPDVQAVTVCVKFTSAMHTDLSAGLAALHFASRHPRSVRAYACSNGYRAKVSAAGKHLRA
jgi:hypothetical protein